jgi:GNAT superfamily N-acetyltransferase
MMPYQATEPFDWEALVGLIRAAFAGMEGRIDPPSSVHRLSAADLARQSQDGEVWVCGTPPVACLVLTPAEGHLHLGKLAVAEGWRGQGLARALVDQAERRALAMGLPEIRLQTRVELVENHAAFGAMGFTLLGSTAHPGYDRPTSLTFGRRAGLAPVSGRAS